MRPPILNRTILAAPFLAALLALGAPSAGARPRVAVPVKKMKVKDDKVKVKTFGGRAKVKDKSGGRRKVKAKGRNAGPAAAIARTLTGRRDAARRSRPAPRRR